MSRRYLCDDAVQVQEPKHHAAAVEGLADEHREWSELGGEEGRRVGARQPGVRLGDVGTPDDPSPLSVEVFRGSASTSGRAGSRRVRHLVEDAAAVYVFLP